MSSKSFGNDAKSKMQIVQVFPSAGVSQELITAQPYEWEKLEWADILQAGFNFIFKCPTN